MLSPFLKHIYIGVRIRPLRSHSCKYPRYWPPLSNDLHNLQFGFDIDPTISEALGKPLRRASFWHYSILTASSFHLAGLDILLDEWCHLTASARIVTLRRAGYFSSRIGRRALQSVHGLVQTQFGAFGRSMDSAA